MKLNLASVSLICLLASLTFSCTGSDDGITKPPTAANLLVNASFEEDGSPSLTGWIPDDTTSQIGYSQDVPPDGGNWSISIEPGWAPQTFSVYSVVSAIPGTNRYQLSFWSKTEDVGGVAYLGFKQADTLIVRKAVNVGSSDTTWSIYSVTDTICADSGDSIVVSLSGGFSEVSCGVTHFDLVTLERLD